MRADGPLTKAHLAVYGAKLAMTLYREHIGTALPMRGAVWCQVLLNGGNGETASDRTKKHRHDGRDGEPGLCF